MFIVLSLGLLAMAQAVHATNPVLHRDTTMDGNYTGPLRPQEHFSPPKNWMNDPNGLFRDAKGTWHLYYQFDPNNVSGGRPHWGHATSKDLYNWANQPIAIYPPRDGTSVYSGSAVIDLNNTSGFFPDQDDGVVAMYTLDSDVEVQEIAYSKDGGMTFEFYDGNPVIPSTLADFRDPKVIWYEDHWAMVVSYAADQTLGIFTSSDLKEWTPTSNFTSPDGSNYECPNLLKLPVRDNNDGKVIDHKYLLTVGVGDDKSSSLGGSSIQYFIGDFDGENFTPDDLDIRHLDWTKDNYAAQFYYGISDDDDAVLIGWAANLQYIGSTPTGSEGWRGSMTLPGSMHFKQRPDGQFGLVSAPYDMSSITNKKLGHKRLGSNDRFTVDYSDVSSNAVMLDLEIKHLRPYHDFASVNATFASATTGEKLRLGYTFDGERGTAFIDRTDIHGDDASPLSPDMFSVSAVELYGSYKLQVVVDRSVADIFDGDGANPGTLLFYPTERLTRFTVETVDLPRHAQAKATLTALKSIWG